MTRASEREPRQSGRGDDIYPVQSATGQTASGSERNDFYRRVLETLVAADAPFLVGGAFAFAHFTGIERHTKDLDIFVRRRDLDAVLDILAEAGCATEHTFAHWLSKAYCGDEFIDVIFSSGNGLATVDDEWFDHAIEAEILGQPVRLCPVEESVWSKSFVMERERNDGADVAHLLLHSLERLDWDRLLRRFGEHWPVLLAHLTIFAYAYPSEAHRMPEWVWTLLHERALRELRTPTENARICRGTFLSREQYLVDLEEWGFRDPRLRPSGPMTATEIVEWTDAIDQDDKHAAEETSHEVDTLDRVD